MDRQNNGTLTDEQIDNAIREKAAQQRAAARRARNYDRAVVIVCRLIFNGTIHIDPEHDKFLGAQEFEAGVKTVLAMLEAFELDSPEREIVDPFNWHK